MSHHANQAVKSGPSSGRDEIRGHNPTYNASVQKESRTQSSTKPVASGSDGDKVVGSGSAPKNVPQEDNVGSYGSGHYTPNK